MYPKEKINVQEPLATVDNFLKKLGTQAVINNIIDGLTSHEKHMSCLYFYDAAGSKLFEEITRLPEYYLSRTEKRLLGEAAFYVRNKLKQIDIVELGSGDCSKISILLEAVPCQHLDSVRYVPVDVSQTAVEESVAVLVKAFPGMYVRGVVADFIHQLDMIPMGLKRFFCFFGSTVGNLSMADARGFFRVLGDAMSEGDMLLLGMDMVKEKSILEKAYNDSKGVTAKFNLNILNVMNDIAYTNFDPTAFEHLAFYNEKFSRMEMHLKAVKDMEIKSPLIKRDIFIRKGETIHTENSHKFTMASVQALASAAGLDIEHVFCDEKKWFSLVLLTKNIRGG
jgi:L-histidine N-alpha-methyltransferase